MGHPAQFNLTASASWQRLGQERYGCHQLCHSILWQFSGYCPVEADRVKYCKGLGRAASETCWVFPVDMVCTVVYRAYEGGENGTAALEIGSWDLSAVICTIGGESEERMFGLQVLCEISSMHMGICCGGGRPGSGVSVCRWCLCAASRLQTGSACMA